jgi:hypothetical protein
MSWRFRKTFRVLPGVKLNLTRHGLSATLGAAPFSLNLGPRGLYGNVSIPGTGIWDRVRLDASADVLPGQLDAGAAPLPAPPPPTALPQATEIRSVSTEFLGSQSLEALGRLLQEAYRERAELAKEITVAESEASVAARRYQSWEHGFLLKGIFKESFARRKQANEVAQAKLEELKEQLRLTTLATQIETDREQAEPYHKLRDEFAALSECQRIWDMLERRKINRIVERSAAHEAIARELVSFSLDSCDLIQWEQKIPHLPNRAGGDLYIYPGFILYRASKQAFALVDSREVTLTFRPVRFIEEAALPSDTQVVGQAWAKSNKDGSPDRRFRNNYQIPVALYGSLTFVSATGLHEEFQVSNAPLAERFAKAWNAFQRSFAPAGGQCDSAAAGHGTTTQQVRPWVQIPCDAAVPTDAATPWANESAEAQRLAAERGQLWEFLLAQELLGPKLARVRQQYAERAGTLGPNQKRPFGGPEYMGWLNEKTHELNTLAQQIAKCAQQEVQAAWAKRDADQILNVVNQLVECCRGLFNWELQISSAEAPVNLRRLGAALSGAGAGIVSEVERFASELGRAVDAAQTGTREYPISLALANPSQIAEFLAEMEEVERHPEWLIF